MSDRNENQTGSATEQLVAETLVEEIDRRHVRGVLGHVGNKGARPRRRVAAAPAGGASAVTVRGAPLPLRHPQVVLPSKTAPSSA